MFVLTTHSVALCRFYTFRLRSESDHPALTSEPRQDTTLWSPVAGRARSSTNSMKMHCCCQCDSNGRYGLKVARSQCDSNGRLCELNCDRHWCDSSAVGCRSNAAAWNCGRLFRFAAERSGVFLFDGSPGCWSSYFRLPMVGRMVPPMAGQMVSYFPMAGRTVSHPQTASNLLMVGQTASNLPMAMTWWKPPLPSSYHYPQLWRLESLTSGTLW